MKTLTYTFIIVFILSSCRMKENKPDTYSMKEDSLIYQLVDSVIMPDSVWRKFLLVPTPLFPEDYSKTELKKREDSLLQRWDTAKLYMAFDDTLILFSKSYHSKRLKNTNQYFNSLENVDTSYFSLLEKLVTDTTLNEKKIEINKIFTNYNYIIIPDDSIGSIISKGERIIEIHQFSRIIFNNGFDKACLYEQGVCGGEGGGGYILFLEKKDGSWRIIMRDLLWVS